MTCPKCGGSGFIRSDEFGMYWACFACGTHRDLIQSQGNGFGDLLREPALGVRGIARPKHMQEGR